MSVLVMAALGLGADSIPTSPAVQVAAARPPELPDRTDNGPTFKHPSPQQT